MNKFLKTLIAIIGAIDVVFSFFTPIAVALILIFTFEFSGVQQFFLIAFASISSFYRAIKVGVLKLIE